MRPYITSELDGSSVVHEIVTHVLVDVALGADGTGGLSSITRTGELTFVFVLPDGSVTVIILLVPSRSHPVDVAVQSTTPLAGVGSGLQIIHGTVTLVHGSTLLNERVTISHD